MLVDLVQHTGKLHNASSRHDILTIHQPNITIILLF